MHHRTPGLVVVLATTVATTWVTAPAHAAAPATCQGKPVTIVATTTVTEGTDGDDVVAMEPGGWNTFDAKGGDDTICLAVGKETVTDHYGGRTTFGTLDAGSGDDTVVNLMPIGTTGAFTTVVLGLGSDTFTGADVGELVYADRREGDFDDPDVPDPELVGDQRDVVTGAATVHSKAPDDGPNQDRITFGTRAGRAVLTGPMGPGGLVDLSASTDPALELRSSLRLGATTGDVVVDNTSRRVSANGTTTLTWVGDVRTFVIGTPRRVTTPGPAVGFLGTDADEGVTFADVPVGDVRMAGGADSLTVQSWNSGFVPRSADGGLGRDTASISAVCLDELSVRLGRSASCDGRSGAFVGFRDVVANGSTTPGASTTVVGTGRGERISVIGHRVKVRAGGGRDQVLVDDSWSARVWAGGGRDRVTASGDDVVVRGERGDDRLVLTGTAGLRAPEGAERRQVARGGPGDDVLTGTDRRGDRLIGGAGRDKADGRGGRRDLCRAERTRRCERP